MHSSAQHHSQTVAVTGVVKRGRGTQVERRIETGGYRCGRQIGRMEIKADNRKEEAENLEAFMKMHDIQKKGFLFLHMQMALPKED